MAKRSTLCLSIKLAILCALCGKTSAVAADKTSDRFKSAAPTPSITIPRVPATEKLTTDLTAAPWNRAARINNLLAGNTRKPAEQPTSIYLCYDPTSLWLAYRCECIDGTKLKTEFTNRDDKVWRDDGVEFYCDPRKTGKMFFQFAINAAGTIYDAANGKPEWNGKFDTLVEKSDKGFTVIMRIPFAQLKTASPKPGSSWAVKFTRQGPTSGSSWIWTYEGIDPPKNFGRLIFGGKTETPVRCTSAPFTAGTNTIAMDNTADMTCRIGCRDYNGTHVSNIDAKRQDKAFTFAIDNDKIRAVDVTIANAKGDTLATWGSLVASPELTGRLADWTNRIKIMSKVSANWPTSIAAEAKRLTADAQPKLIEARQIGENKSAWSKQNWQRLAAILDEFDAELGNLSSLARTLEHFPKAGFAIGFESPMRKVLIKDHVFEGYFDRQVSVSLAANEHEALQVVTIPFDRDLKNVRVRVALDTQQPAAKSAAPTCSVSLVGHVDGDDDPPYDLSYKGFWPDPLLNFQDKADINKGDHVSFWIDVATHKGTPAGDYPGTITVDADGCEPIAIPLTVRVWDFELIDGTHLRTAFTYNETEVAHFHKGRWNSDLAREYHDILLDHRIGVDNLYRREVPDIDDVKYAFSRGANAINTCYTISASNLSRVIERLASFVPKLRKEGLIDKAYFYAFDEIKEDKYADARTVFGAVHRQFPGIRTMTTAYDPTFGKTSGLRNLVDIWVPFTPAYDLAEADKLRKQGKQMWWYICLSPVHPFANWFIEYPTIEARLVVGTMTYKYRADGFLYYMVNLWRDNKKPITSGPYLEWNPASCPNRHKKWANGDGNLIYPGADGPLSSIRLENIRDGLEDYEYLYLLSERVKTIAAMPPTPARQKFLKSAQSLLAVPDTVVRNVVEFTTNPADLSTWRTRTAEAIVAGNAIQKETTK